MKNIHVIPTDKPSRLVLDKDDNILSLQIEDCFMEHQDLVENQHIYIISDEEIKEGDWILDNLLANKKPIRVTKELLEDGLLKEDKKIILTTDQDLIKDGVQAIEDEFLEWLVKNPSCEEVGIKNFEDGDCMIAGTEYVNYSYEIIIPQEETKQEALNEVKRMYNEEEVKQFAFECVANFLSNDDNKLEIKLVDVIIDRLNNQFEKFKKK